ncbi:MAG: NAD(P)H-dependent oxidoreductase [Rhodobacter sp.]|nr:NAD(P)H-dependent oxidoreductase [Rhodobacter sp.]
MARVLVVLAHPEPTSFNAAWADASVAGAEAAGSAVRFCDLHRLGFDPVERGAHYRIDGPFDPLKAQESRPVPPDTAPLAADLEWADQVVLHYPMWWFGPPAVLKGWLDRVLVHGRLHDVDHRFDTGRCRGKRALLCVSTGATAAESGPGGKEGDARLLVWPVAYALRYCGFDICAPVFVHGVHGYLEGAEKAALEARLRQVLAAQAGVMAGLAARELWPFNADTEFDADGRMRPGAPVHWPFITTG